MPSQKEFQLNRETYAGVNEASMLICVLRAGPWGDERYAMQRRHSSNTEGMPSDRWVPRFRYCEANQTTTAFTLAQIWCREISLCCPSVIPIQVSYEYKGINLSSLKKKKYNKDSRIWERNIMFVLVTHPEVGARLSDQRAAWMRAACLTAWSLTRLLHLSKSFLVWWASPLVLFLLPSCRQLA